MIPVPKEDEDYFDINQDHLGPILLQMDFLLQKVILKKDLFHSTFQIPWFYLLITV